MSDLICRNTMTRCLTPGMCSTHGGCRPTQQPGTETVDSVWLAQLRREFVEMGEQVQHLTRRVERLDADNASLRRLNEKRRTYLGLARGAAGIGLSDNLVAAIKELKADRRRLDSGAIVTRDFNEEGDFQNTTRRGLDLRAAIDAAGVKETPK